VTLSGALRLLLTRRYDFTVIPPSVRNHGRQDDLSATERDHLNHHRPHSGTAGGEKLKIATFHCPG
jgi:hypothetical protein